MAFIVLLNLILVLFDLSYLGLRDFWYQGTIKLFGYTLGQNRVPGITLQVPLPPITQWYDPIKQIEENRDTQIYLRKVEQLVQLWEAGETEKSEKLLGELRERSVEMIDTNPFATANRTGNLEKIKNLMRSQMFEDRESSAKQAFREFWSPEYLTPDERQEKLDFFDSQIRPLMVTNFYRPLGENGEFIDYFWLIDLIFIVFFFVPEFLVRTWLISNRRHGISWLDAMLWRWYDCFLLLPVARPLRLIPLIIRLGQARLLDFSHIQRQVSQGFVAGIAEDMTEVVVVRVINQLQKLIRSGEIAKFVGKTTLKPYIDLNDTNETAELAKIVAQLAVYQVMPKVRPDIEALLQHNLEKIFNQFPPYQNMQLIPGAAQLQNNLAKQLVRECYQILYDSLNGVLQEDPVNEQLLERLVTNLTQALGTQFQGQETLARVQYLLDALLEEIKVNYVDSLSEEDIEAILDKNRAIRQHTIE